MGDLWSARFFLSSNLVGRIFFPLLNALQDIFSPPHFSAVFFSSKKGHVFTYTKCTYIYSCFFVLKTGSTRVLSFLRLFSKGHDIETTH